MFVRGRTATDELQGPTQLRRGVGQDDGELVMPKRRITVLVVENTRLKTIDVRFPSALASLVRPGGEPKSHDLECASCAFERRANMPETKQTTARLIDLSEP